MNKLTESQYNDINRIINYYTNTYTALNGAIIEEVAWSSLSDALKRFDPTRGAWYTFFSRVVKSKLDRRLSNDNKLAIKLQTQTKLEMEEVEYTRGNGEFLVLQDEFYDELEATINSFSVEGRNILYLYIMGYSVSTMMKVLGITRRAIKIELEYVLQTLKDRLEGYGTFY